MPDPPTRRFSVLEHRWNGVHWDFLIEDGPALRTWALVAPLAEGPDIPARALPDHRRIYLDYEGPISGGRGEVRRRDGGTAWAEVWEEDRVRLRLAGDQLVGVVEGWAAGDPAEDEPRRWVFRLGKLS